MKERDVSHNILSFSLSWFYVDSLLLVHSQVLKNDPQKSQVITAPDALSGIVPNYCQNTHHIYFVHLSICNETNYT